MDNEMLRNRYREDVAEYFARRRKAARLSQKDLAALTGIAPSNISRFESGSYNPSLDMMVRIADAMGMRLELRLVKQKKGEEY